MFLSVFALLSLVPIILGVYLHVLPPYALMLILVVPDNLLMFRASKRKGVNTDFLYGFVFDSQLIRLLFYVVAGRTLLG